jgi:hypothetical protein
MQYIIDFAYPGYGNTYYIIGKVLSKGVVEIIDLVVNDRVKAERKLKEIQEADSNGGS